MSEVYHEGELAVQRLARAEKAALQNGRTIREEVPDAAKRFLLRQQLLFAGTRDCSGRVWCSVLFGESGFIGVPDSRSLLITPLNAAEEVLWDNLTHHREIGLLAIELHTRKRMRINGTAEVTRSHKLTVTADQVYANCPKYIQAREAFASAPHTLAKRSARRYQALTDAHKEWIAKADTFFIATSSAAGKLDASHRGGPPGFVQFYGDELRFPDYFGNSMFQTLGNIYENSHAGLLFLDFQSGSILQLTGHAALIWEQDAFSRFPGAERLVAFQPREAVEIVHHLPFRWSDAAYSPFNPK